MTKDSASMPEPERIWLEPAPGADDEIGQMWARDNVWGDGATEYVRADLAAAALYLIRNERDNARDGADEAETRTPALSVEPVAWQWSDFSGKWYTVDTAGMPIKDQEAIAGHCAEDHDGRVRALVPAAALATAIRERDEARAEARDWREGAYYKDIEEVEARAAKARADAIEEAAKLASEFTTKRQVMSEVEYWVNDTHGGDATVDEFVPYIADRIAAAIRATLTEGKKP